MELKNKAMKTNINLDLSFIMQWANKNGQFLTGELNGLNLLTAVQPIFSLAHKRVVGYEALLRAKDRKSNWITPAPLFDQNQSTPDLIHLDRLCRYIHLHNFLCLEDPLNWLFLNVDPKTIISGKAYGSYFRELLNHFRFPAHRIVIEVVEHPILDNDLLLETINYYKELGCLIAIDDFGAGHSNFDRIWTLRPDIVKLDRSFLVRASEKKSIRNILPGIVSLLHQAGSLVLIEGVETHDQAMIALESDADFVQGFFFGKPFTKLSGPLNPFNGFHMLLDKYKEKSRIEETKFNGEIHGYRDLFSNAINGLKKGETLEQATKKILTEASAVRCYRIGIDGIQIGGTIVSGSYQAIRDKKFKPLDDAKSADWFRRHYLKRAIYHPEQLQITRPYLSITGAHMCITLSMKFSSIFGQSVLCCDLKV